MPSYVEFLKANGVKSAQCDLVYHTTHGVNNCPDRQFLAHSNLSEAMACASKPLTCTSLRIIQENFEKSFKMIKLIAEIDEFIKNIKNKDCPLQEDYKIILLTDKKHKHVSTNKKVLSIFKTEILGKFGNIENAFLLPYAKNSFNIYIDRINDKKRYVLIEKKENDVKIRRLMPIDCRFSKSYQNKVKKRMTWLIYKYGNINCVTLILTLNPKLFKNNKYLMWINIKKELNRFLTTLKYYFKEIGMLFPKYICTIESQKGRPENNYIAEGNPHLHFVFLGCKRLFDWRKIRKLWGLGHISINKTYDNHKIRHPINYITKYITKTFTKTNDENLLTQSLVWLFGIRSFSSTQGLLIPIKPKSLDEWKPVCLIIGNEFFELLDLPDLDLFSPEFDFDGG